MLNFKPRKSFVVSPIGAALAVFATIVANLVLLGAAVWVVVWVLKAMGVL